MKNRVKKAIVYLIIIVALFLGMTGFVEPLNVSAIQVTMKQSQKEEVIVYYSENPYDIRDRKAIKIISPSEQYRTFFFLVPAKNIYNLDIQFNNQGESNVVDVKSVRVITAFSIKNYKDLKATNYTVEGDFERINIDTDYVFTDFQLTTHIIIILLFGSIFITLIFSKLINKLFKDEENIRRNSKVAIFAGGVIFVGFVSTITYDSNKSALSGELPELPKFSVGSVMDGTFMKNTENYLKNQIPLRDEAIADYYSFHQILQQNLFGGFRYITNLDGRDIILNNTDITWSYVKENITNIEKLSSLLETEEKPYYIYLAPSKEVVHAELFPSYKQYVYYDRVQYFIEEIDNKGINIVDLTEPLEKAAEDRGEEIHFYTDHHWTIDSAFVGYQEIAKGLVADGIVEESTTEYSSKHFEETFAGSAARGIAYGYNFNQQKDDFNLIYPEGGSYTLSGIYDQSSITGTFLEVLSNQYLNPINKNINQYAVYSNVTNKKLTNNNLKNGKTIVVLGDSYSGPIAFFLSQNFENVVLLDQREVEVGEVVNYLQTNDYDVVLNLNYYDSLGDTNLFNYFVEDEETEETEK